MDYDMYVSVLYTPNGSSLWSQLWVEKIDGDKDRVINLIKLKEQAKQMLILENQHLFIRNYGTFASIIQTSGYTRNTSPCWTWEDPLGYSLDPKS